MINQICVTPIILAGGSGKRLWPISRQSFPKQFSKIVGQKSLFQECIDRFSSSSTVKFSDLVVVTNSEFRFIVEEQLKTAGVNRASVLLEPQGKNTAPAILAACLYLKLKRKENNHILIAPADHLISKKEQFLEALSESIKVVNNENIITFGIQPTRAETGFGYLQVEKELGKGLYQIKRFVEKPNKELAQEMIGTKKYFWNSGIFLASLQKMERLYKSQVPEMFNAVKFSVENGQSDLGFFRLEKKSWDTCDMISIDYAIMENIKNIFAVKLKVGWNDLGNWKTVSEEFKGDHTQVVEVGNAKAIDCEKVFLKSQEKAPLLVGLGLKDLIAVATNDAVLISHLDNVQDVGKAVEELERDGKDQVKIFQLEYRPWGWFEVLTESDNFKVKKLVVKPGASLSLQKHQFRSEHWVVVQGEAFVKVDEKETKLKEGESIFVPADTVHRISNNNKKQLIIIEVQTGTYLGEDDIIRLHDIYSRD